MRERVSQQIVFYTYQYYISKDKKSGCLCVYSLWRGDDDEVGDLALLDGSVRARPAEGVGGVDGGRRHRLRQAHPLVHARQVHHRRLQGT